MHRLLDSTREQGQLRKQVLLLLLGSTLFLSLSIGTIGGVRHYLTLEESVRGQAKSAALIVVNNIAPAIAFHDHSEALKTLEALRFIGPIEAAYVVDAKGDFFTGLEIDNNSRQAVLLTEMPDRQEGTRTFEDFDIYDEEDYLGKLYLSVSAEATRKLVVYTLTLDGIMFLFCGLAVYMIGNRVGQNITKPLNSFIEHLEIMTKKKDFTRRYEGDSSEDVDRLFLAFNELLKEVNERDKSLKKQAVSLEKQVATRTLELQQTVDSLEMTKRSVDLARDLILWCSLDGDIVYSNISAQTVLGKTNKNLIGTKFWQIDVSLDENSWKEFLKQEVTKQKKVFATTFQGSDGSQCQVEFTCRLLESNDIAVLFVCARDVTELREKDAQLLQHQRLESIGQLAAGIAHEINTPTQFIGDNCNFLKTSFADLLAYVNEIEAAAQDTSGTVNANNLTTAREKWDIDYLVTEVPTAIEQTLEGVEKVSKIVSAMKEFAHPGTESKVYYDVNSGLKSSAEVCRNEWKYCAVVEFDLDEGSEQVLCYPAQLNQVFLNLIVNAAHAISTRFEDTGELHGCIRIATFFSDASCTIVIEDNGCGIEKSVLDKVFDPFFTTKEVGVGTGQGLSIARSIIVDKHGGTLEVTSEPNAGATFTITLPLTEFSSN